MNSTFFHPNMPFKPTREEKLLIDCLVLKPDERFPDHFRRLSLADWGKILDLSRKHAVAPLLYYKLKTRTGTHAVPDGIMRKLQLEYLSSSARSLTQSGELTKCVNVLHDAGIPVIILKGAYYADVIYGNSALRPMNDLDLLIRESDLSQADKILLEAGYSRRGDVRRDRATKANVGFVSRPGDVIIELHWHLVVPYSSLRIDMNDIWDNAVPTVVGGSEVMVLSVEDLLLYQCYHTAKHMFSYYGLRSLYDIIEIINYNRSPIDWETIMQRARRWNAVNSVYLAFQLAVELLHAPIDRDAIESIKPTRFDQSISDLAVEFIFSKGDKPPALIPENMGRLWNIRRVGEGISLIFRRIFPPKREMEWMYKIPLNSPAIYLSYLYRVADLVYRHHRALLLLLRRDRKMKTYAKHLKKQLILKDWLTLYNR